MALHFFSKLRTRLFLLVLVAILPLLVLTLYSDMKQRRRALAVAEDSAMDLALKLSRSQKNHDRGHAAKPSYPLTASTGANARMRWGVRLFLPGC